MPTDPSRRSRSRPASPPAATPAGARRPPAKCARAASSASARDGAAARRLPRREEVAEHLVDELAAGARRARRLVHDVLGKIEDLAREVLERALQELVDRGDRVHAPAAGAGRAVEARRRSRATAAAAGRATRGRRRSPRPVTGGSDDSASSAKTRVRRVGRPLDRQARARAVPRAAATGSRSSRLRA